MNNQNHLKFDKQFFCDFWQLVKPYWVSEEKWSAIRLLTINILCTIVAVRASVALNHFNKDFFDALQNFDKPALFSCLMRFAMLITIIIFSYGYAFYFNGLLSIRWRRWLTNHYLDKWLGNQMHYRTFLTNNNVDNPDQRISEDLASFPATTLSVTLMFFQSLLSLGSFGFVLWHLSGSLSFQIRSIHFAIPGYLFLSAMFYGILGTWITARIGKKLADLDYLQQQYNADFRFSLIRTREASEQIALYKSEMAEDKIFKKLFSRIFSNYLNINNLRKRLTFFTNGYNSASYFLGIFLAIPLYWQKKVQLGGMMQISGAFAAVISAFSMLVNAFTLFAEWRAIIYRLTEFNQSIAVTNQLASNLKVNEHDENDIILRDLKLTLPNGHTLLNKIDLTFHAGGTFLLEGQSGLGKSTLLRAIAKIWGYGEGEITLPKNKKILFLPQKPYLPLGSLRDVLLYPSQQSVEEVVLEKALMFAELSKFSSQLDAVKNWSHELSLGEQQLIAFARIFLQSPDIIFLDESTSSLDEKTEAHVYGNLKRFLPKSTIVSVGHRQSLKPFHEFIVLLSKEGCLSLLPSKSALQTQTQ